MRHHANGYHRLRTARRRAHGRRTRRNCPAEIHHLWHVVYPPFQAQSHLTRYQSEALEHACPSTKERTALHVMTASEKSCKSVKLRGPLSTQQATMDSRRLKGACNRVADASMARLLHVWQQHVRFHKGVVVASSFSRRDTQPTLISTADS